MTDVVLPVYTDDYVWQVQVSDHGDQWFPLSRPYLANAGSEEIAATPNEVARQVLDRWFATVAAHHEDIDIEDEWVRVSVWHLARLTDYFGRPRWNGKDPEGFCRQLQADRIPPDAVEVRTPYQVIRAVELLAMAGR